MERVGLFYASVTGSCELVAKQIQREFGKEILDIFDIAYTDVSVIAKYSNLIFGIPTWDSNTIDADWSMFLPKVLEKDLSNKRIALFGLGDQANYPDSFVDALGLLYHKISNLDTKIVGSWPTDGYFFNLSGAIRKGKFVGLVVDEEDKVEIVRERIVLWAEILRKEFI